MSKMTDEERNQHFSGRIDHQQVDSLLDALIKRQQPGERTPVILYAAWFSFEGESNSTRQFASNCGSADELADLLEEMASEVRSNYRAAVIRNS
jgi:hypothetical protein